MPLLPACVLFSIQPLTVSVLTPAIAPYWFGVAYCLFAAAFSANHDMWLRADLRSALRPELPVWLAVLPAAACILFATLVTGISTGEGGAPTGSCSSVRSMRLFRSQASASERA